MRKVRLPPGPVVADVVGPTLTDEDRERLRHPAAGAVILFTRNYENSDQLKALLDEIEKLREPALPICVDHEGGRVQRFRDGFTQYPADARARQAVGPRPGPAKETARAAAYIIGAELGAHGVDFSFAPVLDLDYGGSSVIGDRALHFDPNAVGALAAGDHPGLRRRRHGRRRQAFSRSRLCSRRHPPRCRPRRPPAVGNPAEGHRAVSGRRSRPAWPA